MQERFSVSFIYILSCFFSEKKGIRQIIPFFISSDYSKRCLLYFLPPNAGLIKKVLDNSFQIRHGYIDIISNNFVNFIDNLLQHHLGQFKIWI